MSDKFRNTHVISYSYSAGELPTHTKLNGQATQERSAALLIEKALGDLWNQGGASVFSTQGYRNYQPNLARSLGSMNSVNPRVVRTTITTYEDDLTAYAGQTDFYLKYAPQGMLTSVGGSTALGSLKGSKAALQTAGDYFIDGSHLFCVTPLEGSITVEYECEVPGTYDSEESDHPVDFHATTFNVIPDPVEWGTGSYLTVAADTLPAIGNFYRITLPALDTILATQREAENTPAATCTDYYSGSYYRLPYILDSLVDATGAGESVPDGFLYLWDIDTQTILTSVTFKVLSEHELAAIGSTISELKDYALITIGTPLSTAIDNLACIVHKHRHRRQAAYEGDADGAELQHSYLAGLVTPSDSTNYPASTSMPSFRASRWENDDHVQYLHRAGSQNLAQGASGNARDLYDNYMHGWIGFANESINGTSWIHASGDTHGIAFGLGSKIQGILLGSTWYTRVSALLPIAGGTGHLLVGQNLHVGDSATPSSSYMLQFGREQSNGYKNALYFARASLTGPAANTPGPCHIFLGDNGSGQRRPLNAMIWAGSYGFSNTSTGETPLNTDPRVYGYWSGNTFISTKSAGATWYIIASAVQANGFSLTDYLEGALSVLGSDFAISLAGLVNLTHATLSVASGVVSVLASSGTVQNGHAFCRISLPQNAELLEVSIYGYACFDMIVDFGYWDSDWGTDPIDWHTITSKNLNPLGAFLNPAWTVISLSAPYHVVDREDRTYGFCVSQEPTAAYLQNALCIIRVKYQYKNIYL